MASSRELAAMGHQIIHPPGPETCHASGKTRSAQSLLQVMTAAGPAWECLPEARCKSAPCNGQLPGAQPFAGAQQRGGGQQQRFMPYTGDPVQQQIAQAVKAGQRASTEWKELWAQWCDRNGGVRDPAKRSTAELQQAIAEIGQPPAVSTAGNDPVQKQLAEMVRAGQRADEMWKQQWATWCDRNGGLRDPSRRTTEELQRALQEIGNPPQGPGPMALPKTEEHQRIIDQVKLLQRTNPTFKQAWARLCESQKDGLMDPSRHDQAFLQMSLTGLPQ